MFNYFISRHNASFQAPEFLMDSGWTLHPVKAQTFRDFDEAIVACPRGAVIVSEDRLDSLPGYLPG